MDVYNNDANIYLFFYNYFSKKGDVKYVPIPRISMDREAVCGHLCLPVDYTLDSILCAISLQFNLLFLIARHGDLRKSTYRIDLSVCIKRLNLIQNRSSNSFEKV